METPATKTAATLKPGQVFFKGRIVGVQKRGQFTYTLCRLPAEDEFSNPSTVEIQSKTRFGSAGEDFTAHCKVAGYGRSYERKNDDGEKETVHTADHRFYLIEA